MARLKPVQPTVIRDKKIIREVIEQIRKPIPSEIIKRNEELAAMVKEMVDCNRFRPELQ
jgi:hypothetical protein